MHLESKLAYVRSFYKYINAVYMDECIHIYYDKIVQKVFFKKINYLNFEMDNENLSETKGVIRYFQHLVIEGISNWKN